MRQPATAEQAMGTMLRGLVGQLDAISAALNERRP